MIAQFLVLLLAATLGLFAQAGVFEQLPRFPPSYTLHVSHSQANGTRDNSGDNYRILQGFDVRGVISRLYDVSRVRIELPASFKDGEGYDFSMFLPESETREQINGRFRQGLKDYFRLSETYEDRPMDVYVVTATGKRPPAAPTLASEGGKVFSSWLAASSVNAADHPKPPLKVSLSAIRGISLEGTADQFCRTIERVLDRPVVNETNLEGTFSFSAKANETGENDFLARLHDQMGLVITPAQRTVEILVFNPR